MITDVENPSSELDSEVSDPECDPDPPSLLPDDAEADDICLLRAEKRERVALVEIKRGLPLSLGTRFVKPPHSGPFQ